ncbi:hypothetical protein Q2941_43815 [Bradyrhizobium sp. UFLA05-153]
MAWLSRINSVIERRPLAALALVCGIGLVIGTGMAMAIHTHPAGQLSFSGLPARG